MPGVAGSLLGTRMRLIAGIGITLQGDHGDDKQARGDGSPPDTDDRDVCTLIHVRSGCLVSAASADVLGQ
jgi:hypothetical protein